MSHKAVTLLCQLRGAQHPGLSHKHLSVRALRTQSSRVLLLLLLLLQEGSIQGEVRVGRMVNRK